MQNDILCKSWQIVYEVYEGVEKHAVSFLSGELCKYIARVPSVYTLYVVPCVQATEENADKNTIILAAYDENETIRKYISEKDIPENGWLIKTMKQARHY